MEGVVVLQGEVFVPEVEDGVYGGVETHGREGAGCAGELFADLVEMVVVDVGVPESVDEVPRAEAADLGHHHGQQGVGGDVEGNAEEGVGAALVELQREASVGDIELEKGVAGGEVHPLEVSHVPGADDYTARVGVVLYGLHGLAYLVDVAAVVVGPRPPLVAVDMAEVAVFVGPFVPYSDTVFLEIAGVGVPFQEPQQFIDD